MPRRLQPKKPKVLKRKNIKRKTSAGAQAKQIAALSTQVALIQKENYEKVRTSWRMLRKPIGFATSLTATAFMCPIPYSMCDPLGTQPVSSNKYWADNNMPIAGSGLQERYEKRMVFGYSPQATNTNKVYHTGGKLRWQIETNEPSYTKVSLFLIRPKKNQADQLTVDRRLDGAAAGSYPGSAGFLTTDVDFTTYAPSAPGGVPATNETTFGAEINRKFFDVLYKREIALSHPGASSIQNTTQANNTSPANNALVASGSITIPAGGVILNTGSGTQTVDDRSAPAFESSFLDQRNEQGLYLVAIHNDSTADTQSVKLSLICTDYYNAVV